MNVASTAAISLTFLACTLLLRGPAPAGATVEGETGNSIPALAFAPSTATPFIAYDWTPAPETVARGRPPHPGERALTLEQWRAINAAFPEDEHVQAAKVMFCESGGNPAARVLDANGEWSEGAWQMQPVFWGPVPSDLAGQASQAAAAVESQRHDPRGAWWPWSCR